MFGGSASANPQPRSLFIGLKHEDLEQVNRLFREHSYPPEETIFFAGDPAEYLFVVPDGRVTLMHHSLSGKNVLFDLLTPGEFFGSLSTLGDDVYPDIAIETAGVALMPDHLMQL